MQLQIIVNLFFNCLEEEKAKGKTYDGKHF